MIVTTRWSIYGSVAMSLGLAGMFIAGLSKNLVIVPKDVPAIIEIPWHLDQEPVMFSLPDLPLSATASFDPRFAGVIQPPYPFGERRDRYQGHATVRVLVGTSGRVEQADCVAGGSETFCQATRRQALDQWRFRPAMCGALPVATWRIVDVRFDLSTADPARTVTFPTGHFPAPVPPAPPVPIEPAPPAPGLSPPSPWTGRANAAPATGATMALGWPR